MAIYLDNNASTPIDPEVLGAMHQVFSCHPCNPSSFHAYGRHARSLLDSARKEIAAYLGIRPSEFVFTSSGTESLNTLIRGIPAKKIITTRIEHAAVFETISSLEAEIVYLPVGKEGTPNPHDFENLEGDLLVLSAVNSETGALLDLDRFAAIAAAKKIPFIVDGVALLGKERFTIPPGVTAMAFSAHKIHGPTGIGGYFIRSGTKLSPLLTGGSQELKKRAGTENVAGIVGFAKAVSLIPNPETLRRLRDHFESLVPGIVNGEGPRVSNTSNLFFPEISGESLLIRLDLEGVMASQGSACSAGAIEPSRVLLEMGYDKARAANSIRFSFCRMNTLREVEKAAELICSQLSSISTV